MRPEEIRQLRKDIGLSRENFARIFCVAPMTITYWENGQRTPPDIYVANLMRLRQKVDATRANNPDNVPDLGNQMLGFLIAGGLLAFLIWLFANDDN